MIAKDAETRARHLMSRTETVALEGGGGTLARRGTSFTEGMVIHRADKLWLVSTKDV